MVLQTLDFIGHKFEEKHFAVLNEHKVIVSFNRTELCSQVQSETSPYHIASYQLHKIENSNSSWLRIWKLIILYVESSDQGKV